MSLLAKFNEVVVDNVSRLSANDREVCEKFQTDYDDFLRFSKAHIEFHEANPIDNYFFTNNHAVKDIESAMKDRKGSFISNLVHHFHKTYNVTLDSRSIQEKYENVEPLHYDSIVEEVFEQLGGQSFEEKAIRELKGKTVKAVYSRDELSLKGKKISIPNLVYCAGYSSEYRLSYSDTDVKTVFKALSHYLYGAFDMKYPFNHFYKMLESYDYQKEKFEKYETGEDKVLSLKIFKNHKLDIEFESKEYAEQFARDYLGYNPS